MAEFLAAVRSLRATMRGSILILLTALAMAEDHHATPSPLADFPLLTKPRTVVAQVIADLSVMAPGIQISTTAGAVVLSGRIQIEQGPVDGLEALACLSGGKSHETCITLDTAAAEVVNLACKAALGVSDGQPAVESRPIPARGTPLRVTVRWQDPDQPDRWLEVDGSCLIRDRLLDRPYPPLPFVYTGSRFESLVVPGPDGKPMRRDQFMLNATRTVLAVWDEPNALLASAFPDSWRDRHFEVYSAISPPRGTPVAVVIRKAELPMAIAMDAEGGLSQAGAALDDDVLGQLLAKHYSKEATPALRALAVNVAATTARERDEVVRQRILTVASKNKAWVVPVFCLVKSRE